MVEEKEVVALTVSKGDGTVRRLGVNEVTMTEDGKPVVLVRADVMAPLLVFLRKFFQKIQSTNRNASSRFVDAEDFALSVVLRGFTPEDFNTLQSLSNSMTSEFSEILDALGANTPQMKRDLKDPRRYSNVKPRDTPKTLPPKSTVEVLKTIAEKGEVTDVEEVKGSEQGGSPSDPR